MSSYLETWREMFSYPIVEISVFILIYIILLAFIIKRSPNIRRIFSRILDSFFYREIFVNEKNDIEKEERIIRKYNKLNSKFEKLEG